MQFGTDTEHTTGPLKVYSESDLDGEYQPNDSGWPFIVCKPSDAIGTSDYHTAIGLQSKADAYLYAAAPTMLDALVKAQAWVKVYETMPGHDAAAASMGRVIAAAIAAAQVRT
jgi:hypothetical protein